jgi:hypothetical protein
VDVIKSLLVLLGGQEMLDLINLSGKLLGAHVAHAGLNCFLGWCYESF